MPVIDEITKLHSTELDMSRRTIELEARQAEFTDRYVDNLLAQKADLDAPAALDELAQLERGVQALRDKRWQAIQELHRERATAIRAEADKLEHETGQRETQARKLLAQLEELEGVKWLPVKASTRIDPFKLFLAYGDPSHYLRRTQTQRLRTEVETLRQKAHAQEQRPRRSARSMLKPLWPTSAVRGPRRPYIRPRLRSTRRCSLFWRLLMMVFIGREYGPKKSENDAYYDACFTQD